MKEDTNAHFVRTGNTWQPTQARRVADSLEFVLDPAMWQSAETTLIIGKPEWMDLNDLFAPDI